MEDDKILGEGSIQMGLHGDNFLRHGACLVLSSPLDMGGFWRSPAAHPRQNLVQYPPPPPPPGITTSFTDIVLAWSNFNRNMDK